MGRMTDRELLTADVTAQYAHFLQGKKYCVSPLLFYRDCLHLLNSAARFYEIAVRNPQTLHVP